MALTSAFVVYAVLWFLVLFCVLPYRMKSQGDVGEVVPGTPASAPSDPQMKRKFKITSITAFALWVPICLGIVYGYISAETFNLYDVFGPGAE
ncbi:MAG: DUF1467 family protein [Litoreibacter sp.]|nr:DUF1467 family protein [Litoreibacter sp.]